MTYVVVIFLFEYLPEDGHDETFNSFTSRLYIIYLKLSTLIPAKDRTDSRNRTNKFPSCKYQSRTQVFSFREGVQQIQLRTEDKENGNLGAVAP